MWALIVGYILGLAVMFAWLARDLPPSRTPSRSRTVSSLARRERRASIRYGSSRLEYDPLNKGKP